MSGADAQRELESDLVFAIEAARAAGERVLALRATGRWNGDALADVGDQAADGFLQGFVRGRLPDDGILSEETADSPARLSKRRVWIIDPLDGTREFSQLRADWAVHVALTLDGEPMVGAIALPGQGRCMWGVSARGRETSGVHGLPALARGDGATGGRMRIAVSRSHTPSWMPRFAQELDAELVPCGSVGAKVALLLAGEADVYAHRRGLKEWDTCAPEVVARALGWCVGRLDGSRQRYNAPDPRIDELLVCRAGDRARVVAALRAAGAL